MDILFIFLVLENILERYVPILGYHDEIIGIICLLLLIIILLIKKKVLKSVLKILITFIVFLILGVISTLIARMQPERIAIYKDILAISKFTIVYLFGVTNLGKGIKKEKFHNIVIFSKIYIIILFGTMILAEMGLLSFMVTSEERYGFRSFHFLYTHVTFMTASIIALLSVLYVDAPKKNLPYIIMGGITIISGGRLKGVVYLTTLLLLTVLVNKKDKITANIKKHKIDATIWGMILVALIIYISWSKMMQYFSWGLSAARPALYIVGYMLLKRFFPFGSGFGSFASSISGSYYSPIYYLYGISKVDGLHPDNPAYIADTYWPYIYGQFGVIGLILYLYMLGLMCVNTVRIYRERNYALIAAISIWVYIIYASFAESMFTNSFIVFAALLLTYYLNVER